MDYTVMWKNVKLSTLVHKAEKEGERLSNVDVQRKQNVFVHKLLKVIVEIVESYRKETGPLTY